MGPDLPEDGLTSYGGQMVPRWRANLLREKAEVFKKYQETHSPEDEKRYLEIQRELLDREAPPSPPSQEAPRPAAQPDAAPISPEVKTPSQSPAASCPAVDNAKPLTEEELGELTPEQKAMKVLKEEDPIEYFKRAFSHIHHGDEEVFKILMVSIGTQLCSNTSGIHPGLTGESGKGKTHACLSLYHLLHEEAGGYKRRGSFSPQSIYYDKGLKAGAVILLDDVQNLDDSIQDLIKQSSSFFQEPFTRNTVIKQVGATVTVPPRLVFWITTVSAAFEMQFLNRQFIVGVNDTKAQDQAIVEKILQQEMAGINPFEVTAIVIVCRAIDFILKSGPPIQVWIPFVDKLKWNNADNRRNLPMFLDTIKAFTAWRQYQRDKSSDGKVIATMQDFKDALNLWKSAAKEQISKLSRDELLFLEKLREYGERDSYTGRVEIERPQLQDVLGWPSMKMTRIIHGEKGEGGLVSKIKGFRVEPATKLVNKDRRVTFELLIYTGELDPLAQYGDVVSYDPSP